MGAWESSLTSFGSETTDVESILHILVELELNIVKYIWYSFRETWLCWLFNRCRIRVYAKQPSFSCFLEDLKQQLYKSLLNFLAMPGVANGASDILAESRLVSVEDSVPGTGSLHCNQEQNEGYCVCVWLMSASRWEYIDNCRLVTISWCSIRISSGNQESYENLKVRQ